MSACVVVDDVRDDIRCVKVCDGQVVDEMYRDSVSGKFVVRPLAQAAYNLACRVARTCCEGDGTYVFEITYCSFFCEYIVTDMLVDNGDYIIATKTWGQRLERLYDIMDKMPECAYNEDRYQCHWDDMNTITAYGTVVWSHLYGMQTLASVAADMCTDRYLTHQVEQMHL